MHTFAHDSSLNFQTMVIDELDLYLAEKNGDTDKIDDRPPVTIHTFGYGPDHDVELLSEISHTHGGSYYFVSDESSVGSAFGDALGGILSVVAQNIVLTISVPENVGGELVSVCHRKQERLDRNLVKVPLGDLYAEESRNVIFEVALGPNSREQAAVPYASVSLAYSDTNENKMIDFAVALISRPKGKELSSANPHVETQLLRIHATQVMAEAQDICRERGSIKRARAKVMSCLAGIRCAEGIQTDPLVVQMLADLNASLVGLGSWDEYNSHGKMHLESRFQTLSSERSAETLPGGGSIYTNSHKAQMSLKCDVREYGKVKIAPACGNVPKVKTEEEIFSEMRRRRGECVSCGRRCFRRKLFKLIPITQEGRVLNGRCLRCKPL